MYSLSFNQIFIESDFISEELGFSLLIFLSLINLFIFTFIPNFMYVLKKIDENHYEVSGIKKLKFSITQLLILLLTASFSIYLKLTDGDIDHKDSIYMNYAYTILFSKELKNEKDLSPLFRDYKYKDKRDESYSPILGKLLDLRELYYKDFFYKDAFKNPLEKLDYILQLPQEEKDKLCSLFQAIAQDKKIETYEYEHFVHKFEAISLEHKRNLERKKEKTEDEKEKQDNLKIEQSNSEFYKNLEKLKKQNVEEPCCLEDSSNNKK